MNWPAWESTGSTVLHGGKEDRGEAHDGSEIRCSNCQTHPLLVETRQGYQNLCRLITRMKLRAKKSEGIAATEELAELTADSSA
jgi:error-prone DNA polymerase